MKENSPLFAGIERKRNLPMLKNHRITLSDVFAKKGESYLNEHHLFIALYNSIPHCIDENDINCSTACKSFAEIYKSEIEDYYFYKASDKGGKYEFGYVFFMLYGDVIVCFDHFDSRMRILFNLTPFQTIETIIAWARRRRLKTTTKNTSISILVEDRFLGINTEKIKIPKQMVSITENYNNDFAEIHKIIEERLSRKNSKGLVLLHGRPGTGKSTYIRYLASLIKKDVIFMPPSMAASITNPLFIKLLTRHTNSILVIEDAENILIDREANGNSPVSALLNITDGLISDCLNVQVVCSFNTEISKIDKALVRQGRLIAKYEFKDLEVEKANALFEKLGNKRCFTKPMSLAEVYNHGGKVFDQVCTHKHVGFKTTDIF